MRVDGLCQAAFRSLRLSKAGTVFRHLLIINWPGQRVACLEPLLDPIDLRSWLHELDWVITGGETGPGSRKADPRHLREVRDQCAAVGVPLFFKQWGGRHNKRLPNTLDGRKWEQMPDYTSKARF
jgi:protein gp37